MIVMRGRIYRQIFFTFWAGIFKSLIAIPDQSKKSIRLKWNSLYSVCCEFWKRGMYLHQLATNASGLIEIPNLLTQAIPGCLKRWVDSRKEQPVPGDGWRRCLQPREGLSPLMHSHTLIVGQSCHFGPKQIPPTWLSSKKAEPDERNQSFTFCPNIGKPTLPLLNAICLTLRFDRGAGAKNGQIVIMLYAFQDILAKYLNSHLPVIVKTTPSYPLKSQTLHSWQLAWVQLSVYINFKTMSGWKGDP